MIGRPWLLWMVGVGGALQMACASGIFHYENADKALKNEEYEKKIAVKPVEAEAQAPPVTVTPPDQPPAPVKKKKKKHSEKDKETKPMSLVHEPDLEDSVGFKGRRPIKDPFRVGEKVTLNISYFNIVAGALDVAVLPMVEVNGDRAYHFQVSAKSNSFFDKIYSVDDVASTYLLYDKMIPMNLQITLKESKQLAETRTFFDWKDLKANYWKKRVSKDGGEESKKLDWDIEPFSQNVISAVYYLRTFQFEVGRKMAFRVADEGKNIVFSGEVLRKERLKTDIGEFDTVVVRPEITVDGNFTPMGEILFWLTDDDRKFIVRIESKIKIGRLIAKLKALDKGQE